MKNRLIAGILLSGIPLLCGDPFHAKLNDEQKTIHALNRLTWGPRQGDEDRVRKIGLKKWLDLQLHPQRIAENPLLAAKLDVLDTLNMQSGEMAAAYPPPQYIVAVAQGRMALPQDPEMREIVQQLAARYKKRGGQDAGGDDEKLVEQARQRLAEILTPAQLKILRAGPSAEKVQLLDSLNADQLLTVMEATPGKTRGPLLAAATPQLRRKLMRYGKPHEVVATDLMEAKLQRAVYSERQLEDVLTDFWFNHFNVFLDKGADRYLVTSYERDAIRPHVLGKFRDLLAATAQHPAMLFYLDNWQSADPNSGRGKRGLNENYARELMELHTLGVDGGYTQKDVTEVARCFTGWTILQPFRVGEFRFQKGIHDKGEKVVLGVTIPAGGGQEDGEKVLDILARHPSTARFISRQLAQRFVADNPPDSLINRMAATFRKKDGDLREVMNTMLSSPEFWSQGAWRSKVKSPLEMVLSAVRASGADMESAFVLTQKIAELGQPLYRKVEPTGYSNTSDDWVNSASLLGRMNVALALAGNKLPGIKAGDIPDGDPEALAKALLFTTPSDETRKAILAKTETTPITGLVLGSPDFQRR